MTRLAPALVLAGVALVGAAGAASATGHHDKPDTGHTPIVVCHNVTHQPHIIVVDDDSTKLHAHLAHRTQAQLMDLVEGYDGTAAQIRALCVPKPAPSPTSIPTTTPTEVPSSTAPTHSTSTTTTSRPTSPSPTSSTSATQPSVPTATVTTGTPSPSTKPLTAPTKTRSVPTGDSQSPSTRSTSNDTPSPASPRRSEPSSTVAPPELAHTGFTATLAVIGAGLLAAGIAVTRKAVRRGEH